VGATVRVLTRDVPGRRIRFQLSTVAGGEVSVQFRAHVSRVVEGSYRDVVLDTPETYYGKRDLGLEPWLNSRLDGGEALTVPWLENLSEPLEYARATYPEWQGDANRFRQLTGIRPGQTVQMELPTRQDTEKTVNVLVLALVAEGGQGRIPTRSVIGVVTRAKPPQPLVAVTAEAITPFEVEALVRISELDASKTMYVNVEKV